MEYDIECAPTYSLLTAKLGTGETIVAEAGAMTWMSESIVTKTATRSGVFSGLKRKMLGGESFFQNTFTAQEGPGEVGLCSGPAGDIVPYHMDQGDIVLSRGCYLASDEGVSFDPKWQGLSGFLKQGLFALLVTGEGQLFFTSYGAIHEIDVQGEYLVDNGYAVAWDPNLQYTLTRARKIRSFLFSDQLLMRFQGHGKLWVQSRSAQSLANWVHPYRPVKSNNN